MFRVIMALMMLTAVAGAEELRYDDQIPDSIITDDAVLVEFDTSTCPVQFQITTISFTVDSCTNDNSGVQVYLYNAFTHGLCNPNNALWSIAADIPDSDTISTITIDGSTEQLTNERPIQIVLSRRNDDDNINYVIDAAPSAPQQSWSTSNFTGAPVQWLGTPGDLMIWCTYMNTTTWGAIKAAF